MFYRKLTLFAMFLVIQTGLFATSSTSDLEQFQGWWKLTTTFGQSGFAAATLLTAEFTQANNDSYIFIDTSVQPVQITSTYGNAKYPRLGPDINNPPPIPLPPLPGVPNVNSYFFEAPNKLVSPYNPPFSGSVDPTQAQIFNAPTLKLIDKHTLVTFGYLNTHYTSEILIPPPLAIYEKMSKSPVDTTGLDWNDPVNLFKYYANDITYQNESTNKTTGEKNYLGPKKARKIQNKILSSGITVTVPIRKIRVTNFTNYDSIGISGDTWTTIYTGDPETNEGLFVPITPGSSPTISGATGLLSALNGTFENGVGIMNNGGDNTLDNRFVDGGPNGSINDLLNSFLLYLDTSDLTAIADSNGFVPVPPGVTVTVTYRVNAASEYPDLCAACRAYFYLVFRTGTHNFFRPFQFINSARIVPTFADLKAGLATDSVSTHVNDDGPRVGQPQIGSFYHNWYMIGYASGHMVNCPAPLNSTNTLLNYDVAIGNYLVNVHNLYFGIQGTLEEDQPDPTSFGYAPLIPGPGRAHFVGLIQPSDVSSNPGTITPNVPTGYNSMGDQGYDAGNVNGYFFGQINPALTNGEVIGYMRFIDAGFADPLLLMACGVYSPENPNTSNNPRICREGLSAVYSEMMKWFNSIGCRKVIIDWVGNRGGVNVMFSLSEFFGKDRLGRKQYAVPKNYHQKVISNTNPNFKTVANTAKEQVSSLQTMYVSLNEKYYPGSTITGSKKSPASIYFTTDINSYSDGDIAPNFFTGNRDDGNLGAHVKNHIIGCLDGREFGLETFGFLPINTNPASAANNLYDSSGNPVSPLAYLRDAGAIYYRYGEKGVSQLVQHKGIRPVKTPIRGTATGRKRGYALPFSYETTLFPDFGINPPPVNQSLDGPHYIPILPLLATPQLGSLPTLMQPS